MTPKKYGKYSKENLKAASNAIKSGTPTATAASTFGIPRTTLIGKIRGKFPEECKSGVSSVLTKEEEKILTINDNNKNIHPEMIEPPFQNPSAIIDDNKENIPPDMIEFTSQNPNAIINETTPPSRTEDNNGNESKKLIPVNIPTPFKKALFWPDEDSVSKVSKRKKEKIPAVTTSDQWKAYYTKKEEEKKQQEELKESRKKQREENKIKRESEHLQKKRKKETIEEKQESEDKKKEVNKKAIQALQVGDYVIVNFEGTYFPGVTK